LTLKSNEITSDNNMHTKSKK